jgi:two-component system, NarL family, nitrate/nitrite response regulator NarL
MRDEPKLNTEADLKILIADDHKMVAGALSDYLTKVGGFEVNCAHSLDETFDILNEFSDIDIIMLDLKMPGMVGINSVKSVLDAAPKSKVVIFSAYADTVMLERALESGVKGFIPKSLTVKSLPSILRLVDSGQTFFPFKPLQKSPFSQNKDQLTEVEISIVRMIADGATNKHIANETGQTETTIKMVMRSICKKLGAKNRAHAAILGQSLFENEN